MQIQNKEYTVEFHRALTPVTFFHRGREVSKPRMQTTAVLLDHAGAVVDTASVRQFHRDRYDRRVANEASFRKLAFNQTGEFRQGLLTNFFTKPSER